MFAKLSVVALAAVPLVSGLQLFVPEKPTSQGRIIVKWQSAAGDPDTWSFELLNEEFHDAFAIANNVDPAPQQLEILLPVVPVRGGYKLEAVNIGNISDVYASTPEFAIGALTGTPLPSTASSTGTGTGPVTRTIASQPTTNLITTNTAPTTSNTGDSTGTQSAPGAFNSQGSAMANAPLSGALGLGLSIIAGFTMLL